MIPVANEATAAAERSAQESTRGEPVPSYQTYGVLGFLRDREVIRMPSRGEYYLPQDVGARARAAYHGSEGGHIGNAEHSRNGEDVE